MISFFFKFFNLVSSSLRARGFRRAQVSLSLRSELVAGGLLRAGQPVLPGAGGAQAGLQVCLGLLHHDWAIPT